MAPDYDPVSNITELEATNVVVALHTMLAQEDTGGHVLVQCDNLPSVQVFTHGCTHNPVLAECARAIWMLQAKFAVRLSFTHLAGADNLVADALSRAHTSPPYRRLVQDFIATQNIRIVSPCTYIFSCLYPPLLHRLGNELAGNAGGGQTDTGKSPRHAVGTQEHSGGDDRLLHQVWSGSNETITRGHMHVDGITGDEKHFTVTIRNKLSHIRVFLRLAGGSLDGINHIRVSRAMDAMLRRKDLAYNPKDPIPPALLKRVLWTLQETPEAAMVRAAVLLMFFGALRQSEVAPSTIRTFEPLRHLTQGDISIGHPTRIKVKWAKNLQLHNQSKVVTIYPTQDPDVCPVGAITKAIHMMATLPRDAPLLVFPGKNTPMPTSYLRGQWAKMLNAIGESTSKYSLHSLRKASATTAYHGGYSELEVQRHGGWSSNAHRIYIRTDSNKKINDILSKTIT